MSWNMYWTAYLQFLIAICTFVTLIGAVAFLSLWVSDKYDDLSDR